MKTGLVFGGVMLLALGLTGCVKPAQVRSSELPVTRVVVYRNGVAYFERSGEVDDEKIDFQLRQENIGDFLATLAILERGGSSVRAASFPVSMAEAESGGIDPQLQSALDAWERKKRDPRKLRTVTLELDGEDHDLTVGYLAETPLWRPSYRVVVGPDGTADLQVWGIVQNQSGEDWQNVEIALVAGAPIAFESTLGDPVIPIRPLVTDQGEVVSAVPEDSSNYYQEGAPGAPMPEMEMAAAESAQESDAGYGYSYDDESVKKSGASRSVAESKSMAKPMAKSRPAPSPSSAPAPAVMQPRADQKMAQIEVQSGATRYEVPHRVTIPDESATMVLLVSKKVPGEAVHLFAPDPGVSDSFRHPFRVVRFKNESGGLLEKGPIAVFEEGAFLGQGLMSSLPVKAEATVPFALVRDLAIESSVKYDERDVRFYSVENGNLKVQRDHTTLTTYEVQNGDQEPAKLLIKHPRGSDSTLHEPPKGTEDNVKEGAAYVPLAVPKFGNAKLVVEERQPVQVVVDWSSIEARRAIGEYLANGKVKPEHEKILKEILARAEELAKVGDTERRLRREQHELENNAHETRLSLKAIEKNPAAGELRATLTKRLSEGTARLDQITKELVEASLKKSEAEVRLKEARQSLVIPAVD